MSERVRELLWDYTMRTLAPDEKREVDEELARSPSLRAELAELRELSGSLALALPQPTPAPRVKARLLESIAALDPFAPWLEKFARIMDLGLERARELLARTGDREAWSESGLGGLSMIHIEGGPKLAQAIASFLRAKPGFRFPTHRHGGEEVSLVFQGGYRDSLGDIAVKAGDVVAHAGASEHSFVVDPGEDCIAVVIVHGGMEIII